ncbi:bacterial transcriptional activator domain-containing protein [Clostridium estertheticum]|uniref:AfsR/SARP family transcriptional regulator n=1 Tax=Clostridium estertheticum TaxID=238834 RepID=UPI001C0CE816|nr:bacterial transcriptional activator domain-containing protein [Clostridium estertheticum]MBU3200984.1 bacterial transcriptional activator domain-containing protein [Clostridium estertheticum]WAG63406.1 bacterial transcriptional activator domain-containing protein [Clostridium estertheticum]
MLANNLKLTYENDEECLKVYTLGCFEVVLDGKVISNDCKRSQQVWNLFKYTLTYRNKRIVQENFFDVLWNDKECDNPVKALQNLVYRLRMLLDYKGVNKDGESVINYSQGCYSWNKKSHYWTDVDEFEELYEKAKTYEKNEDFLNAIEIFQRALMLYKGDYLCEDSYNEWVMPVRNYYHRIYMDIIANLIKLLKNYRRNKDILRVCEEALMIQPFEESIHLPYIEALIEEGNMVQAQKQYEYVTSMLYEEMGVKPSSDLQKLYSKIKCKNNKGLVDLGSFQKMMMDNHESDGAFFCEPDTFVSVYKLECHRAVRTKQIVFMGLFTITRTKNRTHDSKVMKNGIGSFLNILIQDLREGDVVTAWSETQILVILSGTTYEQANMILDRVVNKYEENSSKKIIVKALLKSIDCSGRQNEKL